MKRAAVVIGVDRTGDLPELKDAARGARRVTDPLCVQMIRAALQAGDVR